MNRPERASTERLPVADATHLASWLGRVQAGGSLAVLLTGGLGSGKSTLLRAAAREAAARSFEIGEIRLPGPVLIVPGEVGDGDEPRQRVVATGLPAIGELLRLARLSADRWLLTMDDAHLHNPDEVASVVQLLEGPRPAPALILLGATDLHQRDDPRYERLVARLDGVPMTVVHRVQLWTGFDVQNLILSRQSEIAPSPRFAFDLAEISGGNPAIVRAYADMTAALPEDQQLAITSGARGLIELEPPALAVRMMEALMAGLSPDERRVLQTMALWGMAADVPTIMELAALEQGVAEQALDALESAHLVSVHNSRITIREPANGRAIVARAPSLLALNVHRRASALLAKRDLPRRHWPVRAAHHIRAGELDLELSGQVLAAAALLMQRGLWASARVLVVPVVMEAISGDTLPPEILIHSVELLADTYTRSGDTATAAALIEATRLPTDAARPGYLASLQEIAIGRMGVGRVVESELTFRYVAAHPNAPPELRTQALTWLIQIMSWHGRPAGALALAERARALAEGEPEAQSELWLQQAGVVRREGRPTDALKAAREALRLASASRDRGAVAKALVAIGESRLDSESADRALLWMRGGLRRSEHASRPLDTTWARTRLVTAMIESGDWENAEFSARRGMNLAASMNFPASRRIAESSLALVRALRGERATSFVRGHLAASDTMSPQTLVAASTAMYEQQRLAELDEPARYTMQLVAEVLSESPGSERALQIEILPRLAATHAERGDVSALEAVVAQFQEMASRSQFMLPIARLEAMVAQARLAILQGRSDNAVTLLEAARSGYQRMTYRWRWAQAAGLIAEAYAESGRKARAIEALRSGLVALDHLGAAREAQRARAQLQALGGRAPRQRAKAPDLTGRQMQVAILASRGLSDREIGRELGITLRTTTTHMHAILKRLNLHSRYELQAWLTQHESRT